MSCGLHDATQMRGAYQSSNMCNGLCWCDVLSDIQQSIQLCWCSYRAHIVGEVTVEVNHRLLALPGVQKTDITRAISHWQVS